MPPRCTRCDADGDAELGEQPAADGARGDARRRLARRGALEDVARVVAVVLEDPGQVGVTGARRACTRALARPSAHRSSRGAGSMISCQFFQSRLRMSIAIGEPSVSPARTPRQELDRVALDLHAAAAAVALLAAGELGVDVGGEQGEPGRHAFEHRDERGTVRFAGGGEADGHRSDDGGRRWLASDGRANATRPDCQLSASRCPEGCTRST